MNERLLVPAKCLGIHISLLEPLIFFLLACSRYTSNFHHKIVATHIFISGDDKLPDDGLCQNIKARALTSYPQPFQVKHLGFQKFYDFYGSIVRGFEIIFPLKLRAQSNFKSMAATATSVPRYFYAIGPQSHFRFNLDSLKSLHCAHIFSSRHTLQIRCLLSRTLISVARPSASGIAKHFT